MIDLKDVICRYPECVQDGKKLKSLLSDLYPSENLYASILCAMLDDGVVNEIKRKNTIDKLTLANLSSRIEAKHGYAQKYIDGCLTIWANAYDIKIASAQDVEKIVPIIKPAPKEKQIDATIHTHKYKTVQIEPTCTEQGYSLHRCDCGYEYKNNFVQPKHDYVLVEYIEPTCETDGRERYKCANCGEEKAVVLQAAGHKFGQWIEQEKPTCEKDGFALRQCKRCGKTERKTIDATGHNFSEWRQEDDNYVRECSGCGKTEKLSNADYYFLEAEKYRSGEGANMDLQKAYDFYFKSAELRNAEAMNWCGRFWEVGWGKKKSINEAIKWYRRAAELKNSSALNNLGVLYEYGSGVPANEALAEEYYRKALEIEPQNATVKNNLYRLLNNRITQKQKNKRTLRIVLITVAIIVIWIVGYTSLVKAVYGELSPKSFGEIMILSIMIVIAAWGISKSK